MISERFVALPRAADDSDWDEVLLRAGIRRNTILLHRLPKRALLLIGVVFALGLVGAGLVGARLHRAEAAPPGPTHIQRHIGNGTVHWLFAHEPRGQSLVEANIPLLSTVGAHWQPVRFARVIIPDPRLQIRVVLSLIGKRGRNICMTVESSRYSYGHGGCAVGLLLKPFNYDISSSINPACSSCGGGVMITGLASDDVRRMTLFLSGGRHKSVPLRDNVFLITLGRSESTANLVAYDRHGLVIGRSAPPTTIHALR